MIKYQYSGDLTIYNVRMHPKTYHGEVEFDSYLCIPSGRHVDQLRGTWYKMNEEIK